MSVVLTACRHSKQRAIERALKKKAEKQRKRQQRRMQAYLDEVEKQKRQLAEQQYLNECRPVELSELALTRMWNFQMMGNIYTVVLLLEAGKDMVDIFCNEDELSYMTDIADGCITFDFLIEGSFKARISCRQHSEGMQHSLTVDGYAVPESD